MQFKTTLVFFCNLAKNLVSANSNKTTTFHGSIRHMGLQVGFPVVYDKTNHHLFQNESNHFASGIKKQLGHFIPSFYQHLHRL